MDAGQVTEPMLDVTSKEPGRSGLGNGSLEGRGLELVGQEMVITTLARQGHHLGDRKILRSGQGICALQLWRRGTPGHLRILTKEENFSGVGDLKENRCSSPAAGAPGEMR